MRRLHLDYQRRAPRMAPEGFAWVAVTALLLATLVGYAGWLRAEIARIEQEQADARMTKVAPVQDTRKVTLQRQEAQEATARIALAWDELFSAIESATKDSQVSLLAIRPDVARRAVRLSAEAQNLPLAIEYAHALSTSGALTNVILVRHEIVNEPQSVVRFSLVATWRPRA